VPDARSSRIARTSSAQGRAQEALTWWRRITALDPLNARFTVGLMEALVAAGALSIAVSAFQEPAAGARGQGEGRGQGA
jgi:two-component SAPR family response regulator